MDHLARDLACFRLAVVRDLARLGCRVLKLALVIMSSEWIGSPAISPVVILPGEVIRFRFALVLQFAGSRSRPLQLTSSLQVIR